MKRVLGVFFGLALLIGIPGMMLPKLLTDYSASTDWSRYRALTVLGAKCTVHWWILSSCSVKMIDRAGDQRVFEVSDSYIGNVSDHRFQALRAIEDPEYATTTLSHELYGRRVGALLLSAFGGLVIIAGALAAGGGGGRDAPVEPRMPGGPAPAPQPAPRPAPSVNRQGQGFGRRRAG